MWGHSLYKLSILQRNNIKLKHIDRNKQWYELRSLIMGTNYKLRLTFRQICQFIFTTYTLNCVIWVFSNQTFSNVKNFLLIKLPTYVVISMQNTYHYINVAPTYVCVIYHSAGVQYSITILGILIASMCIVYGYQ